MMRTREELHEILCNILGSRNCYFSPPSNIRMKYPCIKYEEEAPSVRHADDRRYLKRNRYTLTIIDENVESEIPNRLFESDLKYLDLDRIYVVDRMKHYVYTLYF